MFYLKTNHALSYLFLFCSNETYRKKSRGFHKTNLVEKRFMNFILALKRIE